MLGMHFILTLVVRLLFFFMHAPSLRQKPMYRFIQYLSCHFSCCLPCFFCIMGQSSSFPYTLSSPDSFFHHPFFSLSPAHSSSDFSSVSVFRMNKKKVGNNASIGSSHGISISSVNASTNGSEPIMFSLARNCIKRLKTLRHPNIVKYVNDMETEEEIYLVTEKVVPWRTAYSEDKFTDEEIALGLNKIANAVAFLNEECKLMHWNVQTVAVFLDEAKSWKLGGLEMCFDPAAEVPVYVRRGIELYPEWYKSPELIRPNWNAISSLPVSAIDSYSLGCLIYDVYNEKFDSKEQLLNVSKIPKDLVADYRKLISNTARSRQIPSAFVNSAFFKLHPFVQAVAFLENLSIYANEEKEAFFTNLLSVLSNFCAKAIFNHLLPHLSAAIEYGNSVSKPVGDSIASATPLQVHPKSLSCLLKIGTMLCEDDFNARVTPLLVKLFAVPERSIRLQLLTQLPDYIACLSKSLVSEQIIQHVAIGFTDANSVLREATIKSMLYFLPKLNESCLSSLVLPYLGKLQGDQEPIIRTNTTLLLGKIAPALSETVRSKFTPSAFLRMFNDSFPKARSAGLSSIMLTLECYSSSILAKTIMPQVSALTIDSVRDVRESALRCLTACIEKLAKFSDDVNEADVVATQGVLSKKDPSKSTPLAETKTTMMGEIGGWALNSISNVVFAAADNLQTKEVKKIESIEQKADIPLPLVSVLVKPASSQEDVRSNFSASGAWDDAFFEDITEDNSLNALSFHPVRSKEKKPTSKTLLKNFESRSPATNLLEKPSMQGKSLERVVDGAREWNQHHEVSAKKEVKSKTKSALMSEQKSAVVTSKPSLTKKSLADEDWDAFLNN